MILRKTLFILALLLLNIANLYQDALALSSSKQPITVHANQLTVEQNNSLARFEGNVIAKQGEMTLHSDILTIHYNSDQQSSNSSSDDPIQSNKIDKILVDGNILLTTTTETAKGDQGVYDLSKKQLDLKGNVVLTRGKNIIKGSHLTHYLESGNTEIRHLSDNKNNSSSNNRVSGVFIPQSDEE